MSHLLHTTGSMSDTFYRRNLPHIHPEGYPLFITFRLADTLPLEILTELRAEREREGRSSLKKAWNELDEFEKKYFTHYDDWLDRCVSGRRWLESDNIANIVYEKILEMHNNRYEVLTFCIMPNHVHMLIEHLSGKAGRHHGKSVNYAVTETLRLLKGSTARACNVALRRTGQFWHHESYDHFVRNDEELERTIQYILNNPVKAGLVQEWKDWKFTFINPDLGEW